MRIVAFAGPSRPSFDERIHAIDWRPPAARGDLDDLDVSEDDVVALIDGVMITGHSPSPTECFRLLSRGTRLVGSSSIGALRAVELRNLGMAGYGWVYQNVLARSIVADDELVADLDPRSFAARVVFLANVRFGLEKAERSMAVTPPAARAIIEELQGMHFSERSRTAVLATMDRAGLSPETAEYVLRPDHDIKKIDARLLLDSITSGQER